jgi:hypothetical protein
MSSTLGAGVSRWVGVVHANVCQNVTPHNPSLGLFLHHFLHTMSLWRHESIHNNATTNKHHHHGDGAAHPSSGMDSMIPHCPRGGRPCACSFQGHCWRILFDSLNLCRNHIFLLTLWLIELGLIRRQQWWPKRHPSSSAAAHNIRTSSKHSNRH